MPPALVLVHGGGHDGRCWAPTVDALARLAPDVPTLAVDLPGRGRSPMRLEDVSIEANVAAVVRQVDELGAPEVVLVGHSLAGITIPQVAAELGPQRTRRLVFVACCVPPDGGCVLDTLRGPLRPLAARGARSQRSGTLAWPIARATFCNGMTREQRTFVRDRLVAEASHLTTERVDRGALPRTIPRTWVRTLRDRSLSQAVQRRSIANLGGVQRCIDVDACHDVMVSHPDELARILVGELAALTD